ncbi:MAG: amino acid permease [Proteobacteria bacterium]|nr:amino acid permease [Pseudomonadota bacterium]
MSSSSAQPTRALGLRDTTLFLVTAGSALQWTAVAAATGPSSLAMWVAGGLAFFLPLSVSVVYLAARYPDDGGMFAWSERAFGPFTGFLTGWTYWAGTVVYLPAKLYFAAGSARLASAGIDAASVTPAWFIGFSFTLLALAVVLNLRGLVVARWLNNAGAVGRWVGALLLVTLALGSWWRFGSATPINRHAAVPTFRLADVIFWTTLAFCWTGPEAVSFMRGEIRDPHRTIPRAFVLAAPMITAIYMLGTASILLAIPAEHASGVYGVMEAVRGAASRLGLSWLIPLGAVCIVLDCAGSVCLWIGALARIPLTWQAARAAAPQRVVTAAIWIQAIIVALLVVLGQSGTSVRGAYNVLIEMMVVASMLPFLLLFGAAIRLSAGAPVSGEIRIPGGRVTVVLLAVLGVATTAFSIVLGFVPPPNEPDPALATLKVAGVTAAVILGGVLAYAIGRARQRTGA